MIRNGRAEGHKQRQPLHITGTITLTLRQARDQGIFAIRTKRSCGSVTRFALSMFRNLTDKALASVASLLCQNTPSKSIRADLTGP